MIGHIPHYPQICNANSNRFGLHLDREFNIAVLGLSNVALAKGFSAGENRRMYKKQNTT